MADDAPTCDCKKIIQQSPPPPNEEAPPLAEEFNMNEDFDFTGMIDFDANVMDMNFSEQNNETVGMLGLEHNRMPPVLDQYSLPMDLFPLYSPAGKTPNQSLLVGAHEQHGTHEGLQGSSLQDGPVPAFHENQDVDDEEENYDDDKYSYNRAREGGEEIGMFRSESVQDKSKDTPGSSGENSGSGKVTIMIDDPEPQTLVAVMDILVKSRSRMTFERN
jgi:hypothetical protein